MIDRCFSLAIDDRNVECPVVVDEALSIVVICAGCWESGRMMSVSDVAEESNSCGGGFEAVPGEGGPSSTDP